MDRRLVAAVMVCVVLSSCMPGEQAGDVTSPKPSQTRSASAPVMVAPAMTLPGILVLSRSDTSSPSGTSLLVYQGGASRVVNVPHWPRALRLTPDGLYIVGQLRDAAGISYMWSYEIASGAAMLHKVDLPVPAPRDHGVMWSPDARRLAVIGREDPLLWVLHIGGDTRRVAVPPWDWREPPSGERLYGVAWRGNDEVTFFTGAAALPTTQARAWSWSLQDDPVAFGGPLSLPRLPTVRWSPDGSRLAYEGLSADGSTVLRVRDGGRDLTVLASDAFLDPRDATKTSPDMDLSDVQWDASGSALLAVGHGIGVQGTYFAAVARPGERARLFMAPSYCYTRIIAWSGGAPAVSCSQATPDGRGELVLLDPQTGGVRSTVPMGQKGSLLAAADASGFAVEAPNGLVLVPSTDPTRSVDLGKGLEFVGWCCSATRP